MCEERAESMTNRGASTTACNQRTPRGQVGGGLTINHSQLNPLTLVSMFEQAQLLRLAEFRWLPRGQVLGDDDEQA